jgi:aldose 1-epimerase
MQAVNIRLGIATVIALASLGCSTAQTPPQSPEASPSVDPPAAEPPSEAQSNQAEPADAKKLSPIAKKAFGTADGQEVFEYALTNSRGMTLKVITYGAIVTELHVPDKAGKLADVVLGFDNLDGYLKGNPYFGATVGRVGNRIRDAKFKLGGKEYVLAANNKPHHLHGGNKGWDKVVWKAEAKETPDGPQIHLTYTSPDGEEGYPGTVVASTTYTLTNDGAFRVEMAATTDKSTIVNMVHHTYWNLGGHDSGRISDHELQLFAAQYTPGDPMVPTGVIRPVKGSPFDFTKSKPIGKDLEAAGGKPVGFDHNFVIDGDANTLRPVARLRDPKSGRVLTIEADQPGLQFYSGNFLDGTTIGKGGTKYAQYTGLCLETQKFPNAVNVPKWRDQVTLEPGRPYKHTMIHRFTNE